MLLGCLFFDADLPYPERQPEPRDGHVLRGGRGSRIRPLSIEAAQSRGVRCPNGMAAPGEPREDPAVAKTRPAGFLGRAGQHRGDTQVVSGVVVRIAGVRSVKVLSAVVRNVRLEIAAGYWECRIRSRCAGGVLPRVCAHFSAWTGGAAPCVPWVRESPSAYALDVRNGPRWVCRCGPVRSCPSRMARPSENS